MSDERGGMSASKKRKLAIVCTALMSELLDSDSSSSNFSSSSSSSSSEDDDFFLIATERAERENEVVPRVQQYEEIIAGFRDQDFKTHFRMNRSTFEALRNEISNSLRNTGTGRNTIAPEKQLLMTIWSLVTADTYSSIGSRFDVCKSTLWETARRVWTALASLSKKYIEWPSNTAMEHVSENFQKIAGFPRVIGCIDGCHIPIKARVDYPDAFINKKRFHSVLLQAVVDDRSTFTNCYAGEGGALDDGEVFEKSHIGLNLQDMVPAHMHLLGDAAYPLKWNLLTPLKNNRRLTPAQKRYNCSLAKTRTTVIRAFSLLKSRFKRLKFLDMGRLDIVPTVIMACCVLHNICQLHNDEIEIDYNISRDEMNQTLLNENRDEIDEGTAKINEIINLL